ncbi:MAG: MarR family transcriptional regulator [Bacillota bacterium]|nr:MarR family transcriptional regulator [Bacillota bacterium]
MYSLNNEITESFYKINKAIYRLIKKEADRLGITVVQLKALYRISIYPDIGLGELAEKLRLTNSTVSGVIDRLVQQELVVRSVPPENRRAISLTITSKGMEILEKIASPDSLFYQKMESVINLPKKEIQELLRLHNLVLSKLSLDEE